MRPQYTEEDFRQIDSYASMFGIEVIPCMQTLAHLIDVIKWPAYQAFSDTSDILLVGDERTYQFVEDMIVQVMKPFRTKRIHIGMDEAWKVGRGSYEDLHGPRKHRRIAVNLPEILLGVLRPHIAKIGVALQYSWAGSGLGYSGKPPRRCAG